MWLDEFVDLLVSIRDRADIVSGLPGRNEAVTRSALIDAVLEHLGWDVHDPEQVVPEYSTGESKKGFADYALFGVNAEKPSLFVEAKALGRTGRRA
jgi:predicted type IV restriction endonuclease